MKELEELRQAISCLALELPYQVYRDVQRKFDNLNAALPRIPPQTEFQKIQELANKALEEAAEHKIGECCNFADLGCYDVRYWHDAEGRHGWHLMIDEADPSDVVLRGHVAQRLSEAGYDKESLDIQLVW